MRKYCVATLALLLIILSCSSMTVYSSLEKTRYSAANANFNMLVNTGNKILNDYVNNLAYFEFSKYVPINEQRPLTGTLEVIFQTKTKTVDNISSSSQSQTQINGNASPGYYPNSVQYNENQTTYANQEVELSSIDYQNSTMFLIMKDLNGNRVWGAHYNYKGQTELMGVLVNTPQEAAKVCITKIAKELGSQFSR